MDPVMAILAAIPLAQETLTKLCDVIQQYRSYGDGVEDLRLKNKTCNIRLEDVYKGIEAMSKQSLSESRRAVIHELHAKLSRLQQAMERKIEKAQDLGALRWSLFQYGRKLHTLRDDLLSWLEETEETLLRLNRDGLNQFLGQPAHLAGSPLARKTQLQSIAGLGGSQFPQGPVQISPQEFVGDSEYGRHEFGRVRNVDANFMVEYLTFPSSHNHTFEAQSAADAQIIQLSNLLHNAQKCDGGIPVLKCSYFFKDHIARRYGILSAVTGHPYSMKHLLASPAQEPPLQVKFMLAKEIFASVRRLHVYGWLHKSLRSENIYFFDKSRDPAARWEPKLVGFEYSRQIEQVSTRMTASDHVDNLHRHPDRWNDPIVTFSRKHDVYAVSVVLAEIYLWRNVDSWENGKLLTDRDPVRVSQLLQSMVKRDLPRVAGSKVAEVVLACLEGTWRTTPVEDALEDMAKVLGELADAIQ